MKRRSFFTTLAALGSAAGWLRPAKTLGSTVEQVARPTEIEIVREQVLTVEVAASAVAQPTSPRRIPLQVSPLAGYHYYAGDTLWPLMRTGDNLTLVREPANPHDEKAIRVEWEGTKLGYLPRNQNITIAGLMDAGEDVMAGIAYLREMERAWERVGVELVLWM